MTHAGFIFTAYGLAAVVLLVLVGWVTADGLALRQRLADLDARGVRRRSDRKGAGS